MTVVEFSWLIASLVIVIAYAVHSWSSRKHSENLPPGSMGYPFIGEVIQFLASHPGYSLSPYMKDIIERFGSIFKTRLMGKIVIVSADAEFNHFVLQKESRLFKAWYPGVSGIFGFEREEAPLHKYLRNLSLNLLGSDSLKQSQCFLSEMDRSVSDALSSWSALPNNNHLDLKEAIYHMLFSLTAKRLISLDTKSRLINAFHGVWSGCGFISVPSRIKTGKNFRRLAQTGRKRVIKALEREIDDRLVGARRRQSEAADLLDLLVQEMRKDGNVLRKEVAVEYIFLLLFASLQTTPMATALAVKLLTDHPDVLERLSKEHDGVLGEREEDGRSWISWEEYKNMTYTAMVIKEVLRLVTPFLLRKTLQDIDVKGYTIPKGCPVLLHLPSVHMDPHLFPQPSSFDPSRWKDLKAETNYGYMPFGGGPRLCLGMDFGKLFMTIFLHQLVTKYRWKIVQGGEVIQKPLVEFPSGFRVQIFPRA